VGLAAEVAEEGIRVNGMVPIKRGGQPEEVAAASGYCQTKRRSSRAPFWMYQGDDEKQA